MEDAFRCPFCVVYLKFKPQVCIAEYKCNIINKSFLEGTTISPYNSEEY